MSIRQNSIYFSEKFTPAKIVDLVKALSSGHEKWRLEESINLNAGESALSPAAKELLSSDLTRRVADGKSGLRKSKGAKYIDEIEALTLELVKKLFNVEYAEFRLWGGSSANALSIRCLTEVGDTIFAVETPRGHMTYREMGYAGHRGLRIIDIPYDYEEFNIDLEQLRKRAKNVKAKLMIVGTSVFLFPHPLKELHEIAQELGAKIMYDGAHVLGLIATGRFQDPLREGAHVLTGSTQKTLSGPVGGLILHNDSNLNEKVKNLLSGYQGTVGFDLAALIVTLAEMLQFGGEFMGQVVKNAKALAIALDKEGFDVVGKQFGYTESHTVLVDVSRLGGGMKVAETLEKANIMCSAFSIRPKEQWPNGLRLGTTEMTRYGMNETDVKKVAEFIGKTIISREDPRKIARDVTEFRKSFLTTKYCFNSTCAQ
jgi:glycine hydroxymethyltransferase